ncbi:hypothetical protein ACFVH4_02925 [Nocardia ignorata]|uniref:hypothetical protein n=1 Tax=Nocardia ignorata TaxID=145285 RepID=UPI00362C762A
MIGLVVGSVLTVFALVVGAAVWLAWPESAGSNAPFYQALSSLSGKPALRYRTTVPSSAHTWDVTVTATGDTTGTVSVDGQSSEIVRAGGQLYLGPASGKGNDLGRAPISVANQDKWQTAPDAITTEAAAFSTPRCWQAGRRSSWTTRTSAAVSRSTVSPRCARKPRRAPSTSHRDSHRHPHRDRLGRGPPRRPL